MVRNLSFLLVVLVLVQLSAEPTRADQIPSLTAISKFAGDVCAKPELYGYTRNASGAIKGHIDIPLLAKRFVDLGLSSQLSVSVGDWKNIPQAEIAASVSDYRRCALAITEFVLTLYKPHLQVTPQTPDISHHRRGGSPSTKRYDDSSGDGSSFEITDSIQPISVRADRRSVSVHFSIEAARPLRLFRFRGEQAFVLTVGSQACAARDDDVAGFALFDSEVTADAVQKLPLLQVGDKTLFGPTAICGKDVHVGDKVHITGAFGVSDNGAISEYSIDYDAGEVTSLAGEPTDNSGVLDNSIRPPGQRQ